MPSMQSMSTSRSLQVFGLEGRGRVEAVIYLGGKLWLLHLPEGEAPHLPPLAIFSQMKLEAKALQVNLFKGNHYTVERIRAVGLGPGTGAQSQGGHSTLREPGVLRLYVPFFSSHSLAFRSTWPRQGELPGAGRLFFRTAALFTGSGPSASLVSQLDMGEFSRVRCLKTGDC